MNHIEELLRSIAGENVFGLDVDSRIRSAANSLSARLMIETFARCNKESKDWIIDFLTSLEEYSVGDPSLLVGFDDGRWQGLTEGDETIDYTECEGKDYFLKLEFHSEDACFYQFCMFPALDEPFILGASRKREGKYQFLSVELAHEEDLQVFIQHLRGNPFLVAVLESHEEEFIQAKSQNTGY